MRIVRAIRSVSYLRTKEKRMTYSQKEHAIQKMLGKISAMMPEKPCEEALLVSSARQGLKNYQQYLQTQCAVYYINKQEE